VLDISDMPHLVEEEEKLLVFLKVVENLERKSMVRRLAAETVLDVLHQPLPATRAAFQFCLERNPF
jgi:hypothetical protein